MKLSEFNQNWEDVHRALLDLLDVVEDDWLFEKPTERGMSIHQMVLQLAHEQRFHVSMLLAKNHYMQAHPSEYPDKESLRDLLLATWQLIEHILEPLTPEGLKAVRLLPANPEANQHETNVNLAWLLWHALHQEIYYSGQIAVRIRDYRIPRNPWD